MGGVTEPEKSRHQVDFHQHPPKSFQRTLESNLVSGFWRFNLVCAPLAHKWLSAGTRKLYVPEVGHSTGLPAMLRPKLVSPDSGKVFINSLLATSVGAGPRRWRVLGSRRTRSSPTEKQSRAATEAEHSALCVHSSRAPQSPPCRRNPPASHASRPRRACAKPAVPVQLALGAASWATTRCAQALVCRTESWFSRLSPAR